MAGRLTLIGLGVVKQAHELLDVELQAHHLGRKVVQQRWIHTRARIIQIRDRFTHADAESTFPEPVRNGHGKAWIVR